MSDPRISPANTKPAAQKTIRIGTRGSPLALVQARQIASALEAVSGGVYHGEIVTFTTTGDKLTSERLINSGGKGLFTTEIDTALDDGDIDIGVHSMKDVPSILPTGQVLLAIPEREDPREAFLSPHGKSLSDMPIGARIGTASLRREAQTLARRKDVKIVTFRGNVATRMRKLEEGLADATYLAMAGLTRLGVAHLGSPIPLDEMLPAAAQGIVGVIGREDMPTDLRDALARITHTSTEAQCTAERAFLAGLDGSCRTPIAGHLFDQDDHWHMRGEVLAIDGQTVWSATLDAPRDASLKDLEALGARLANKIRDAAGGELPAFEDDH